MQRHLATPIKITKAYDPRAQQFASEHSSCGYPAHPSMQSTGTGGQRIRCSTVGNSSLPHERKQASVHVWGCFIHCGASPCGMLVSSERGPSLRTNRNNLPGILQSEKEARYKTARVDYCFMFKKGREKNIHWNFLWFALGSTEKVSKQLVTLVFLSRGQERVRRGGRRCKGDFSLFLSWMHVNVLPVWKKKILF